MLPRCQPLGEVLSGCKLGVCANVNSDVRTVDAMQLNVLPDADLSTHRRVRGAQVLLVVGAGGVLGAAVLARALGSARFARVQALVAQPLSNTLPGFEPLPAARLDGALQAQTAVIVFERARRNNGRDDAFVQPAPQELPQIAQRLLAGGVRRLLVVVPHAPALLPQALKSGLASLDEGRVAAMGFEQLLLMRAAQSSQTQGTAAGWAQKLAAWWLSQLSWMVPQPEQPVRVVRVAELVVELAWQLRDAPTGTRVLPPELLWQAAHSADGGGALLDDWLHRRPLPPPQASAQRW